MSLVFITRQGCHLCEAAEQLLQELGEAPQVLDVDQDEALFALYDWRVPVVLFNSEVIAEGRIDREQLRRALASGREPLA